MSLDYRDKGVHLRAQIYQVEGFDLENRSRAVHLSESSFEKLGGYHEVRLYGPEGRPVGYLGSRKAREQLIELARLANNGEFNPESHQVFVLHKIDKPGWKARKERRGTAAPVDVRRNGTSNDSKYKPSAGRIR